MTTRAFFLFFLLISLSISPSFSDNQKPLRITIHPTIINQNVVGSSTTIISSKTIKENSYMPLGKLLSKFSGINFENLYSDIPALEANLLTASPKVSFSIFVKKSKIPPCSPLLKQ